MNKIKLILAVFLCAWLSGCSPALAKESLTDWGVTATEIVYQTIAMESANQSFDGQVAVASVIVNRSVVSHKSLLVICKAPKQFSCWNSQKWAKAWLRSYYTPEVRQGAKKALEMALQKPLNGITHYHTKDVRPSWAKGHRPNLIIGSHWFYRGIK